MTTQGENSAVMVRLEEIGLFVRDSHVVYTSGKHGSAYVNIARAFNYADLAVWFAEQMVPLIEHLKFETIVGPTHSDDKVGQALAILYYQKTGRVVHPVYAKEKTRMAKLRWEEKDAEVIVPGEFVFPRGQADFVRGKRVIIIGDVLTTGGTMDGVIKLVQETQGIILNLLVACNRSQYQGSYRDFPLLELMNVPMEAWDPPCPLCRENMPINPHVGHGAKYLESLRIGTVS